ncbi:hypothetical protein SAMN02927937_01187 [Paenimyroides aquimaris]|uniref:Deoxyuridine 5'-triphosphate nucleotidohydrolase n=1 Tax=Paenimyroides marinum TaxID=1159016 RepID=A0A1H6KSS9_9FLAO|nr:hypothetical protein [Paenimyroides aquimaris]SEH74722.1 hypothetical protein SAMN02927937_01187 [Paenimyroides aquimaris]
MILPKELKEAITHLSSTEKDKLIFRLLKKDLPLANRLLFELVSTETVEEKRNKIQKSLAFQIERAVEQFYSPGYLSMDVRYMSGMINEHVQITKDKFGEPYLNLLILNGIIPKLNKKLETYKPIKANKFYVPALARIFKILMNISKFHEDEQYEFRVNLNKLGKSIAENPDFMKAAINNGLDINWLLNAEIPENIVQIHKNIRALGLLK